MPISTKAEQADDYESVFRQYLDICNQAIVANKGKFPYTEMWRSRFEAIKNDSYINAVIFDDRPKLTCRLDVTSELEIKISNRHDPSTQDAWPFSYQYMKRVIANPDEYIANPARLQWGWLQYILNP